MLPIGVSNLLSKRLVLLEGGLNSTGIQIKLGSMFSL